jgi:hypothetical protein
VVHLVKISLHNHVGVFRYIRRISEKENSFSLTSRVGLCYKSLVLFAFPSHGKVNVAVRNGGSVKARTRPAGGDAKRSPSTVYKYLLHRKHPSFREKVVIFREEFVESGEISTQSIFPTNFVHPGDCMRRL